MGRMFVFAEGALTCIVRSAPDSTAGRADCGKLQCDSVLSKEVRSQIGHSFLKHPQRSKNPKANRRLSLG